MMPNEPGPRAANVLAMEEATRAALQGDTVPDLGAGGRGTAVEPLWRTYAMINEWIRFADAKAGVIFTANVVILTAATSALKGEKAFLLSNALVLLVAVVGAAALLASAGCCLRCILPRMRGGVQHMAEPRSPIFFGSIADFPTVEEYRAAARTLGTDEGAFREVSRQVWINAWVATEKHRMVRASIWAMALGLFCALVVGVAATR